MDEERRRSDDRWQGGIEKEVANLKVEVAALRSTTSELLTGLTELRGEVKSTRRELSESRKEVREAAKQIDKGREEAVQSLTDEIAAKHAEGMAWKLGVRQIILGCILTAVLATISSLIVLAASGQLG